MTKEIVEVRLNDQHTKDGSISETVFKRNFFDKFNFTKKELREMKKEQLRKKIEELTR